MTPTTPADVEAQKPQILWRCEMTKLGDGPDVGAFTVGAKFSLKCSGPSLPKAWNELPEIGFAKEDDAFTLVPLNLGKASENEAELVVTGYKPGQHKPDYITLGTGDNQVRVEGLQWNVNSVVQAEQGKPPQPFPPYGPIILFWPWWLWATIVGSILFIALFVWWRVRRTLARKRLIERLADRGAALSAYAQLHKDLRGLMRRYQGRTSVDDTHKPDEYLMGLDQSLRQYLSRTLLVPAQEWSDGAIVRDIKRRHRRVYKETGVELNRLLSELRRARNAKGLTFTDCEQIHEMGRKVAEKIEVMKPKEAGR